MSDDLDSSATSQVPEGLRNSSPGWRIAGLVLYLALAWPLYPDVEEYSRPANVVNGLTMALAILAIVGSGFWLGARWRGRPKTWARATLSVGALLTAFLLAVISLAGRNAEEREAAGLAAMTRPFSR